MVAPIGFICDHVEVLYDLDVEAARVAREARRDDGACGDRRRASAVYRDDRWRFDSRAIARLTRRRSGARRWLTAAHRESQFWAAESAGLSAAFRLQELSAKHDAPLEVTLMERGPRLGGALCTIREQGFIAEAGADSFLTEKPWALDLVRRLGLEGELIATRAEFRRTYVVRNGALAEIPEGFSLLAPTRMLPMLRSPLLSPLGKLRVMIEPLIPRRRGHRDESLASFVTRRLGREVLERIAQPLAGGIYTADPEQLSLHATLPRFADMEARYGSVIRGLRAAARKQGAESGKSINRAAPAARDGACSRASAAESAR